MPRLKMRFPEAVDPILSTIQLSAQILHPIEGHKDGRILIIRIAKQEQVQEVRAKVEKFGLIFVEELP